MKISKKTEILVKAQRSAQEDWRRLVSLFGLEGTDEQTRRIVKRAHWLAHRLALEALAALQEEEDAAGEELHIPINTDVLEVTLEATKDRTYSYFPLSRCRRWSKGEQVEKIHEQVHLCADCG